VNVRKLQMLARWDKDCADTVEWLRKNQHRFKMEVFEPPAISLTVPDKRFVDHVEACFSANQLKVCLDADDQDWSLTDLPCSVSWRNVKTI
jgi:structural maintenance of chromosomes protein 5